MGESPPSKRQRTKGAGDPTAFARRDIDECAKRSDVEGALAVFHRATAEEVNLPAHSYNVLLHLCAGGNQGEDAPRRLFPREATVVYEHMLSRNVQPLEMTYTALARVTASSGDPTHAYQLTKDMRAKGVVPRLRTFSPALAGFCKALELESALTVEADIRASGIALSEVEYIALLEGFTRSLKGSAPLELLRRMKDDIRLASPDLLAAIRACFESSESPWTIESVLVNEAGVCVSDSKVQLLSVDLTDDERSELASAIAALSRAREHHMQNFDGFIEWSNRHGPFDTIVDGANVGMYNQNFEDARFNFAQVERLMALLRNERGPDAKPALLVLHQRRVKGGPANAPRAASLINQWRAKNELYTSPAGSNDDWYWLYAAVNAGPQGMLVTNDELRDHVFQMLPSPRLFYKWKELHQVRFQISASGIVLQRPPPFTTCIQEAADGSWWMFPCSENEGWLCAKKLGV